MYNTHLTKHFLVIYNNNNKFIFKMILFLHIGVAEPLRMVTCTQLSLIDPLEVHVEVPPVHIAEPVLTPIGMHASFF